MANRRRIAPVILGKIGFLFARQRIGVPPISLWRLAAQCLISVALVGCNARQDAGHRERPPSVIENQVCGRIGPLLLKCVVSESSYDAFGVRAHFYSKRDRSTIMLYADGSSIGIPRALIDDDFSGKCVISAIGCEPLLCSVSIPNSGLHATEQQGLGLLVMLDSSRGMVTVTFDTEYVGRSHEADCVLAERDGAWLYDIGSEDPLGAMNARSLLYSPPGAVLVEVFRRCAAVVPKYAGKDNGVILALPPLDGAFPVLIPVDAELAVTVGEFCLGTEHSVRNLIVPIGTTVALRPSDVSMETPSICVLTQDVATSGVAIRFVIEVEDGRALCSNVPLGDYRLTFLSPNGRILEERTVTIELGGAVSNR